MKNNLLKLFLFVPCAFFSQVGINTPSPTETLDVNGTLKVRNTTKQPNGRLSPIFVDEDGLVVKGDTDPTKLTTSFLYNNNSSTGILYNNLGQRDAYNRGDINYVSITKNEVLGNIKTSDSNLLIIEEPGIYEIASSIKYGFMADDASNNRIYTTFTLQVSDEQNSTWKDLATRNSDVYSNTAGTLFSLDLPSTFVELKNKSKFRLIFKRTRYYNSTVFIGNKLAGISMNQGPGTISLIFKKI